MFAYRRCSWNCYLWIAGSLVVEKVTLITYSLMIMPYDVISIGPHCFRQWLKWLYLGHNELMASYKLNQSSQVLMWKYSRNFCLSVRFYWNTEVPHAFCLIIHYGDVIMGMIASQITSLTIVYSTIYSDADQRKHQSFSSLAFVCGIHQRPVNSPHKWQVTRKMFPFDDVIMHRGHIQCSQLWSSIRSGNLVFYCNISLASLS